MLLELAIGDAYGAGFEYVNPSVVSSKNDLTGYVQHPTHSTRPGCYTDDTQMSIAVAEAILSDEPWTERLLAGRFVGAFKRDPREGYASSFYYFLHRTRDGDDFLQNIRPDSDKSGAAMRAAPVGVCASVPEVIQKCSVQAAITHNTPDGIKAAVAVALTAHYFLYRLGKKADLGQFLEKRVEGEWSRPWEGKVGGKGWMSVRAALTALAGNSRMSDLLKDCVAFTGDVDTVASIALGIGSCCEEIEQDLPADLINGLENGPYGRDYLIDLDQKLLAQVPANP
jgi:ADP-ribosylglycohydrolase